MQACLGCGFPSKCKMLLQDWFALPSELIVRREVVGHVDRQTYLGGLTIPDSLVSDKSLGSIQNARLDSANLRPL